MKKREIKLKRIPQWYLYLALAYAIIGLLDAFLLFRGFNLLIPILTVIGIAWIIFNATMLFYFKRGYERASFILPAYYIAFFLLAYLFISIASTVKFAIWLQTGSSVFELVLVLYFLLRK
jgi:hypothetical protein